MLIRISSGKTILQGKSRKLHHPFILRIHVLSLQMTGWLFFCTGNCQSERPVSSGFFPVVNNTRGSLTRLLCSLLFCCWIITENFTSNIWSRGAPYFIPRSCQPCGIRDLNDMLEQACLLAHILNEVRKNKPFLDHRSEYDHILYVCKVLWVPSEGRCYKLVLLFCV